MPDDKETGFHRILSLIQDVFTLLRDVFIAALIVLLLAFPQWLNRKLISAGFTSASLGPLQWANKEQTQAAGQQVSQGKFDIQDATGALEAIARKPHSENTSKDIEAVVTKLKASQTAIDAADSTLKNSLQQQQQVIEKADPTVKETAEGWMFLGHIDENHNWTSVNAKTLQGRDPSLSGSQRLQVTDSTYLRADMPAGQRFSGAVLGLLPVGEKVDATEINSSSHALRGGWFVWAKVKRVAAGT